MPEQPGAVERVVSSGLCAGCGLCASMFGAEKITMQLREPGYLRPNVQQHLSPEEERQFEDTCPGIRLDLPETEAATHPIWGPIIKVRVGAATDNVIRHEGSSGRSAVCAIVLFAGAGQGPQRRPYRSIVRHANHE